MPRLLPEKCRLCSKLATPEARTKACWDAALCPSRRSYIRHRDRRNLDRRRQRRHALLQAEPERLRVSAAVAERILQAPYAVLHLYRGAVDAPLHAIGGEIWQGEAPVRRLQPVHCCGLTAGQVEEYLEAVLHLLYESYGIRQFASHLELAPGLCPIRPCPLRGEEA